MPYTGMFCEGILGAQPCNDIDCANGGRCYVTGEGVPQCECPVGTGGRLCDKDTLDECQTVSSPCHRGYCIDALRSYYCNCPEWDIEMYHLVLHEIKRRQLLPELFYYFIGLFSLCITVYYSNYNLFEYIKIYIMCYFLLMKSFICVLKIKLIFRWL